MVADWPPVALLQRSATAYLLVNAGHIAALGLLFGSSLLVDLRLLGLFRSAPLAVLGPLLARSAAVGLALAMLTGGWLFLVNAAEYVRNPAFLVKLGLVGLGVLNALGLHLRHGWQRLWTAERLPAGVRAQAVLSLLLWPGALLAGRWIGFA